MIMGGNAWSRGVIAAGFNPKVNPGSAATA